MAFVAVGLLAPRNFKSPDTASHAVSAIRGELQIIADNPDVSLPVDDMGPAFDMC